MKRLIASVGVVAAGLAGTEAAAQADGKPWSVSASVRAFYDDNITTIPDQSVITWSDMPYTGPGDIPQDLPADFRARVVDTVDADGNPMQVLRIEQLLRKEDSFGMDLIPTLRYHYHNDMTEVQAGYTFGGRMYQEREPDKWDISHNLSGKITHRSGGGLSFELEDVLRVAQEPEVLSGNLLRSRGNNDYLHNKASVTASQQLRGTLSVQAGYINELYEYDDPAFAVHLDRIEHTPLLHLKSQFREDTVGLIGYRYKIVDYTSDRVFEGLDLPSDFRNSEAHYFYAGLDRVFSPRVQGSVRLGLQHTRYHNFGQNANSPFADASLSYGYAEGSSLRLGVKHERNRYDLANPYTQGSAEADPILDQEQTLVYGGVSQRITPRLSGSVLVQYVRGELEGGGSLLDGSDRYWAVGLGLDYTFSQTFSAEAGWNLDSYDSGVLPQYRSYDRNRVYIGLRASY